MRAEPLILIVEDEYNIRQDLVKVLALNKFQTLDTDDGNVAVQWAKSEMPDLIISDVMMPKLDGYSFYQTLQQDATTSTIPFLFLSAKSSKEDRRIGMNLGADDYITKPFDIMELVEAVKSRIEKKKKTIDVLNKRYEDLKQSLYRNIPHEIRTPLNIILGYSDILIKTVGQNSTEKNIEMLGYIQSDAKRLQNMFENFIFLSKLEVYHTNPEELKVLWRKKTIYAETLAKDIFFFYAHQNKRLDDLSLELEETDLKICEEHFVKIIEALADNAFKFSTTGDKVTIHSSKINDQYVIACKNEGIGISPENIPHIAAFKQFKRDKMEQQGNGLGLTIVKSLLKIYGGDIKIDSVENKYANVVISLPFV